MTKLEDKVLRLSTNAVVRRLETPTRLNELACVLCVCSSGQKGEFEEVRRGR